MARKPKADAPEVEDMQRRADAFARRAYADVFVRFEPLRTRPSNIDASSETSDVSESDAETPHHDRTGPVSTCRKFPRG